MKSFPVAPESIDKMRLIVISKNRGGLGALLFVALLVSCFWTPLLKVEVAAAAELFSASFSSTSDGFTYADDTFRATKNPTYASGNYSTTVGYSGGGLRVALGGVDNLWKYNMSGGWKRGFSLSADSVVTVSVRYRMVFAGDYESDEYSQVLVAVDGQLYSGGSQDYVLKYTGTGDGTTAQDSGWRQVTFQVPLSAGSHTLTIGGYNNKKTYANEATQIFFDDVVVTQNSSADLIFFDNFSDGNANGWTVINDAGKTSSWTVTGGKYAQLNDWVSEWSKSYHLGTHAYYTSGMAWTDYQVQLNLRPLAEASGGRDSIGVMVRYYNDNNYIRFLMSRMHGFMRLESRINGNFKTLSHSGRGINLQETNHIRVVVRCGELVCSDGADNDGDGQVNESKIMAYVNGEPVLSAESAAPANGTVALFTQSMAQFDDVIVSEANDLPRIAIQTPVAHSVAVPGTTASSYELQVAAQAVDLPSGHGVKFTIDAGTPAEITDYTDSYSGKFSNVPAGDRKVLAYIVDQNDDPLFDVMEQDEDYNVGVGVGGKILVAFGDSITNGVGDDIEIDNNATNGKNFSRGYTPILTGMLSSYLSQSRPVYVANEGLGGTTSKDGRDRLAETIARFPQSKIWLILFGTNDSYGAFPVLSGVSCKEPENFDPANASYNSDCLSTFKGYMRAVVLGLKNKNMVPVMAYVPFVRNATTSRINLIKEYNQVIRDLNLYHALPAASPDLFTHFSDPANQDQFFDDVHPNGDGYIDVAGLWYERLISGNILN